MEENLQPDVSPSIEEGATVRKLPTVDDLKRFADVNVVFSAVLGETKMSLEQLLKLGQGAIFMLDGHKDDLLSLRINDHPVGTGEISVYDSTISVKVIDLFGGNDSLDDDPMAAAMAGMDDDPMAAAMAEMDDDPMAAAMAEGMDE